MRRLRPLLLVGTRPEAIKLAPVIAECRRRAPAVEPVVCLTGQHREMLEQVVDYFALEPDLRLDLMRPDQSLADITARSLTAIDGAIADVAPDCVVVQGDTVTAMAGALAAFYRRVPVVHVEAGLRTGDLAAPWPEELDRRVIGIIASLHCAPTARAAANLRAEGVDPARIVVTGNTVVDALLSTLERERDAGWDREFAMLGSGHVVLVTGHRRENYGAGLASVCEAVAELSRRFPDAAFVYPVHLSPRVQAPVRAALTGRPNVHLLDPVAYPGFVWLMARATVIVTDSGGVQEEAPSLRTPVLVTRAATERPEAIEAGAAELVGTDRAAIVDRVARLLDDPAERARRQIDRNPYGDGGAAPRVVDAMVAREWRRSRSEP